MENMPTVVSGSCSVNRTEECDRSGAPAIPSRPGYTPSRPEPELPGIKLSTYRIKGSLREHGNLLSSADAETVSKPPSPAMSRLRGGAFVVVGARESRVHGEGRQSMSMAARPLG